MTWVRKGRVKRVESNQAINHISPFRREWAAFLDAWCPLPAFRSCFVEVTQHSNDLLMNLWGRNLPILFFHHLGTAPPQIIFYYGNNQSCLNIVFMPVMWYMGTDSLLVNWHTNYFHIKLPVPRLM